MAELDYIVLDDIALQAGGLFAHSLREIVRTKGVASFVLAGGGTPLALYRVMSGPLYSNDVPWEAVHFFWGDERLVPPDDSGSNYRGAWESLLSAVPVPPENIHRIRGELPAAAAVDHYTEQLRVWAAAHDPGAPHPWPRFDMVLLGLGEDGHTASLFPGSPVEAAAPVIAVKADYQGRPAGRVTLTPLIFNDARQIAFLVSGTQKADAVYNTFYHDDPVRYPARRIQGAGSSRLTWFLDRDAARRLDWRGHHLPN